MNLPSLKSKEAVVRSLYRTRLLAQKHSPEIFLGAGVVGVVAGTVMACKATYEGLPEIVLDAREKFYMINAVSEVSEEVQYSKESERRDRVVASAQVILGLAKLYGPAIMVEAISIGLIIQGHRILNKRNAALAGAYTILDQGFKEYRERVKEELGEEADAKYRYGISPEEKSGKTESKGEPEKVYPDGPPPWSASIYAKFFTEASVYWRTDPTLNMFFLQSVQNYVNDMLHMQGHVFLNEVYDRLGLPRTSEGAMVGWLYRPEDEERDSVIDFQIHNPINIDFVNGYQDWCLLDFNVDGPIYDKI